MESSSEEPMSRCFKLFDVQLKQEPLWIDAITALLALRTVPVGREKDLEPYIPDDDDLVQFIKALKKHIVTVTNRAETAALIEQHKLSENEVAALIAFTMEAPYPVYRWLNGHLTSSRRDPTAIAALAPFYILWFRGYEKLPRVVVKASRTVQVLDIPTLRNTFKNYETMCAPGCDLSFWGVTSFSTSDKTVNEEQFTGSVNSDAIQYAVGRMSGVNMAPFSVVPKEEEVTPPAPCVFRVVVATAAGSKLVIALEQLDEDVAYIVPRNTPHQRKQREEDGATAGKTKTDASSPKQGDDSDDLETVELIPGSEDAVLFDMGMLEGEDLKDARLKVRAARKKGAEASSSSNQAEGGAAEQRKQRAGGNAVPAPNNPQLSPQPDQWQRENDANRLRLAQLMKMRDELKTAEQELKTAKEREKVRAEKDTWPCPTCTYRTAPSKGKCDICDTPRPGYSQEPQGQSTMHPVGGGTYQQHQQQQQPHASDMKSKDRCNQAAPLASPVLQATRQGAMEQGVLKVRCGRCGGVNAVDFTNIVFPICSGTQFRCGSCGALNEIP